jgi:hypothetical protein
MSRRNTLTDTDENKYIRTTGTRGIANKKRESYPTDQHAQCITEEIKMTSCIFHWTHSFCLSRIPTASKKVKSSRYRPGVAQRVPGGLGSQIFMTFGTWRWWGRQSHAPATFTPRNVPVTHFHQGLSRPHGHGAVGRRHVIEKFSDTTGNRSRDRPTSSAAP